MTCVKIVSDMVLVQQLVTSKSMLPMLPLKTPLCAPTGTLVFPLILPHKFNLITHKVSEGQVPHGLIDVSHLFELRSDYFSAIIYKIYMNLSEVLILLVNENIRLCPKS